MKTLMKHFSRLIRILVCAVVLFAFPVCSLAADEAETVAVPDSAIFSIPNAAEISDDLNYSEGATVNTFGFMSILANGGSVSGGCSITKVSSSSVRIYGYSITSPSDPGLKVSLQLQAYYNEGWHTLATKGKSITGTRVELTQTYNVTSGYYYRVIATHSLADGTAATSGSSSVWVG
jgi:hypothetical protein